MNNYLIAKVKDEDASLLVSLIKNSIQHAFEKYYQLWSPSQNIEFLDEWLSNKTTDNVIKWIDNDENYFIKAYSKKDLCLGCALLNHHDKKNIGEIKLCYVHPNMQRLGVGGILVNELEYFALEKNIKKIVTYSSLSAYLFYTKHKYQINLNLNKHPSLLHLNKRVEYYLEKYI